MGYSCFKEESWTITSTTLLIFLLNLRMGIGFWNQRDIVKCKHAHPQWGQQLNCLNKVGVKASSEKRKTKNYSTMLNKTEDNYERIKC